MKLLRKLKNRRGVTLVEVLMVVALMAILLGVAMPNLIAESQDMKLTALDGYARAVAVAAQSKLYGMKNAGTAQDSAYYLLNDEAAIGVNIDTGEGPKTVNYVSNFGDEKKAEAGKKYLLSGALTDPEILQNGKIVVVYDPVTADVWEVYYGESEFPVKSLFPSVTTAFLESHRIGYYRGEGAPEPERNIGLPDFTIIWQYDDEMYLQLQMVGSPDPSLYDKNLGLEVFATIPDPNDREKEVELLLYAEGIFATDYGVTVYRDGKQEVDVKIRKDAGSLTIDKIEDNGGILRFALDSLITKNANYGEAAPYLRHQTNPDAITMADTTLYPRDTVANWFNKSTNPYLDFGKQEGLGSSGDVYDAVTSKTAITDIIHVDESIRLRVELHVLSETEDGRLATHDAAGDFVDTTRGKAQLCDFDDEHFVPMVRTSENVSPYFFALSEYQNTVTLSSMRDLNNLSYLFKTENSIDQAILSADIDGQQLQDKLIIVRHALVAKQPSIRDFWNYAVNWSAGTIDPSFFRYKEQFTLSGTRPNGGGSYKINCLRLGQSPEPGGLFTYAKNCTFRDLDIVNPLIWRNGTTRDFLLQNETSAPTDITGLRMNWNPAAAGALVGIAVNCTFENVRTYIDVSQVLKVEGTDNPNAERGNQTINQYRISGTILGGLVGIAIGSDGTETTFKNCAASALVGSDVAWPTAECIYAGGLVGLAMGSVRITDSYAASEISGYYAGGLVGGTGNGRWFFGGFPVQGDSSSGNVDESGTASGNLSLQDSFAAGNMMYNIRVGGGLIGYVGTNNTPKDTTGCYSAVHWQILPPVTYGTFEGDTQNYYLYQKEFDFPVTANVLARFTCEGDVLSLKGNGKNGIACSAQMLKTKLEAKLNAEGATKWTTVTATHKWAYTDTMYPLFVDHIGESYPFLMPAKNTVFYGVWNSSYDADDTLMKVPDFGQTFNGFYVAYYDLHLDYGSGRYVDVGSVFNFADLARKIELKDNKVHVMVKAGENTGEYVLQEDGKLVREGVEQTYVYWSRDILHPDYTYGQGIDGATKITVQNGKLDFYSAAYYVPGYNAVKGCTFCPTSPEGLSYGGIPLIWDYCGYYFTNYGNNEYNPQKYYISFKKEDGGTVEAGTAALGKAYPNAGFNTIVVNEKEFKDALHYGHITLSDKNVSLQWAEAGYFEVVDTPGTSG